MRRSRRTSSGQRAGWRARYLGDSGSSCVSSAAATTGDEPPSMNNVRHPAVDSRRMPSRPANVAPRGTQTMAMVTASGRRGSGTYSAASVAALGIAPPRPMPASRRNAASALTPCTKAAASVIAPNTTMSEQRGAAAEAIAREAGRGAADHHAEIAERDDRREGGAWDAPLFHDRGDRHAQELVVDAVEDDGQRGEEDEPRLVASQAAAVEELTDIDGRAGGAGGGLGHASHLRRRERAVSIAALGRMPLVTRVRLSDIRHAIFALTDPRRSWLTVAPCTHQEVRA